MAEAQSQSRLVRAESSEVVLVAGLFWGGSWESGFEVGCSRMGSRHGAWRLGLTGKESSAVVCGSGFEPSELACGGALGVVVGRREGGAEEGDGGEGDGCELHDCGCDCWLMS